IHLRSMVSSVLVWFILDAGKQVFIGKADLMIFLITIIGVSAVFFVTYKVSKVFDIRNKITNLLIGFPVYSQQGNWVGKIEDVNREQGILAFKEIKTNKTVIIHQEELSFIDGKIVLSK
ncbi:MAG: hypothetical protein Q7K42_03190, partial [Candidatus Diapherotrites archaeon]|nr:hypothetical protein [Candidatus Diapherotrites archaeon]